MATVRYRLIVTPSPSPSTEKMEFEYRINGGPVNHVDPFDLPPDTTSIEWDFPVGATVEWFGVWFGPGPNNYAVSNHRTFVATNLEQVQAGATDQEVFIRYNP